MARSTFILLAFGCALTALVIITSRHISAATSGLQLQTHSQDLTASIVQGPSGTHPGTAQAQALASTTLAAVDASQLQPATSPTSSDHVNGNRLPDSQPTDSGATSSAQLLNRDKLTVVLVSHFKDIPRSLVGIASLKKNFPSWAVRELLIIVPFAESLVLSKTLATVAGASAPWPVTVLPENEILGVTLEEFRAVPVYNYRLQMALKLFVARHVQTDFYLVMDSDIVMVQPIQNPTWLYPLPGRAVYAPHRRAVHAAWWTQTENYLGLGGCLPQDLNATLFGVTPAILSKNIAEHTVDYMIQRFGPQPSKWLPALLSRTSPKWTEFCAYRLMACKLGVFQNYHALHAPGTPKLYAGLWRNNKDKGVALLSAAEGADKKIEPCTDCIFLVVQSNTKVPERKVVEDMAHIFV